MKSFRLTRGDGSQQTWAGCLVLALTVLVALPGAIGFGVWLVNIWPWPQVKVPGEVIIIMTIAIGLGFYFGASAILHWLNIPTWPQLPISEIVMDESEAHDRLSK